MWLQEEFWPINVKKNLIVYSKRMHLARAWSSAETDRAGLYKASLINLPLERWHLTQSPYFRGYHLNVALNLKQHS